MYGTNLDQAYEDIEAGSDVIILSAEECFYLGLLGGFTTCDDFTYREADIIGWKVMLSNNDVDFTLVDFDEQLFVKVTDGTRRAIINAV